MSGGVDSSAAVKLLLDMGYDVSGATMRLFNNEDAGLERERTCCSLKDVEDARYAAFRLGVDFYVFNFSDEFREKVIGNFVDTYLAGGTPNPCIQCNKHLKFSGFLNRALTLGYDYIATGHYALREFDEQSGKWLLKRSPFRGKDQSYVLYCITQEQLSRTLFPVGGLEKSEIRKIAAETGLANAEKPDSQDICFIPDGDHGKFIERAAGSQQAGDILLTDGRKVGRHKGLIHYTVGQRRGVGVSYSEPLFVLEKNVEENRLILGTSSENRCTSLTARQVNFISGEFLQKDLECTAQTRYHQKEVPCVVSPIGEDSVKVTFLQPHAAVSKGQSVVFYNGEVVLGGGIIVDSER